MSGLSRSHANKPIFMSRRFKAGGDPSSVGVWLLIRYSQSGH